MKRAEKREHLVEVATSLFNRRGYRAVGIDQVIAESGVAKTTLYRHFDSKESLIVEVLDRLDSRYREDMRQYVEQASDEPGGQLLASFDFLEIWCRNRAFHGCPFIGAAGEYSERSSPVFQAAARHKAQVKAYFERLARKAGLARPKQVAEEINLLHEGVVAVAHISGNHALARRAKELAAARLTTPSP